MGFEHPEVVHYQELTDGYTYFVMFGEGKQTVDYASLSEEGFDIEYMSEEQIEAFAVEHIGRPIVVVGAATGTDTHSVGIDAMLNLKGFHGHHGLEGYRAFETHNLGSQVPNSVLVSRAIDLHADAILVSQTVTQQNLHVTNLTELVEIVEAEGRRRQLILTCGGPRVSNELAKELGFDAGFSKGTYPHHVASFIVRELAARLGGQTSTATDVPAAASADGVSADEREWLRPRPSGSAGCSQTCAALALVGLAKNTGKTETLAAILAEHAAAGRTVGVTSIGRDGERHDVIDARIDKPSVRLQAGGLVASTGALLRASGLAHERIERTGVRTPLGEVVLARLSEPGAVEVAGPSAAADVRAVAERMLALGAEQVLIDGAIDRRAASSPAVADGLVMATGAILGEDIEAVVDATRDAVDLVRLPPGKRRRSLAGVAGSC